MSKKRKTRKEKLIAQLRRQNQIIRTPQTHQDKKEESQEITPKYSFEGATITQPKSTHYVEKNYTHVFKDAQKTLLITAIIIVLNAGLYFALQNKLISLGVFGL